ncbi:hypothetical protein [Hafnia psychrotolerans]|nr:hypothetical protein [Hafnia psychrotolerans]
MKNGEAAFKNDAVLVLNNPKAAFKNGAEQEVRDLRLETRREGTA